MTTVNVNGLNFHVNRLRTGSPGDRPVVVCVHGLAIVDNAAASFLVGFHLASEAEVICYDLRGHGKTDRPPTGYSILDHAADLWGLIDVLGIDGPVHLVAFSYGGAVVSAAALQRPERLASLCLLDGLVPIAGWAPLLDGQLEDIEAWREEVRAQGMSEAEIDAEVAKRAVDVYGLTPRRAVAVTRRIHTLFESTSMKQDLHADQNGVVFPEDDFRRIQCPVLGVYGDRSKIYWLTEVLPRLCRDVTLHTIPGADHMEVFWRIHEYRHLVRDFILRSADRS
jgi:pimeloyl-ACP methyl ester carboxylesterase